MTARARFIGVGLVLGLTGCRAAPLATPADPPAPAPRASVAMVLQKAQQRGDFDLCAVSDDGRFVAVGSDEGAVEVWDVERELRTLELDTNEGPVRALAFDRTGRLYLVKRGLLCHLEPHQNTPAPECTPLLDMSKQSLAAFDPDVTRVVYQQRAAKKADVGNHPATLVVAKIDGQPIVEIPQEQWLRKLAFSNEGDQVLTEYRTVVRGFDAVTGTPMGRGHPWPSMPSPLLPDPGDRITWTEWVDATSVRLVGSAEWELDLTALSVERVADEGRPVSRPSLQPPVSLNGQYAAFADDQRHGVKRIGGDALWSRRLRGDNFLVLNDGRSVTRRPLRDLGTGFLAIQEAISRQSRDGLVLTVRDARGRFQRTVTVEERAITIAAIAAPDGRSVFLGAYHDVLEPTPGIVQASLETGEILRRFDGPHTTTNRLALSPDGRFLSTASRGRAYLWNVETGARIVIAVEGDEWVVYDQSGHFAASRRGDALLGGVQRGQAFPIRTAAVVLNRPDILLEELGLGEQPAVEVYRSAYEDRLRRLGLDPDQLDTQLAKAPTAELTVATPPIERHVRVRLAGTGHDLRGYVVLANGVPVAEGRLHAGTAEVALELEHGTNRITATVRDAHGRESQPATVMLEVEGPPPDRKVFFVGVGTSRFVEPQLELAYAAKDVRDFGDALAQRVPDSALHSLVLTDEQVAGGALEDIRTFVASSSVDDTIIVMVAGHGVHAGTEGRYYYLPHDTRVSDVPGTGWSFEELESTISSAPARSRLVLLDTCESGERDDERVASRVEGARPRTSRALVFVDAPQRAAKEHARDRYLYNDVRSRNGAIVLSSSTGNELSYEFDALQNGAFTEAILEALSGRGDADGDGSLGTDELRRYVQRRVPELTAGAQHPRLDRDNREQSIVLPAR